MVNLTDFLDRCADLSERSGLSISTLSFRIFNDGSRIKGLIGGKDVGVRRLERAVHDLEAIEAQFPIAPASLTKTDRGALALPDPTVELVGEGGAVFLTEDRERTGLSPLPSSGGAEGP